MESYKKWVRVNKDYVHSMESLVNGLTWLLPEMFSESEIGPEAVTSILGIATAVNDHIIKATPTQTHPRHVEPSSFPYALCITVLKDLETLVEVVAQHFNGDDIKWNFIAITEATKVLVRLALFQNRGYKMLLQGGETTNKGSDASNAARGHGNLMNQGRYGNSHFEGRARSALNKFGQQARSVSEPAWLPRVQPQKAIMEPPTIKSKRPTLSSILSEKGIPGGLFVMGEVLFVSRPLFYVLLIRKYGVRSWFPWFISLAVDLIGMGSLSLVKKSGTSRNNQYFHLSNSVKDERQSLSFMRDLKAN